MEAKQRKKKGPHERNKLNVRQIASLTAPGVYADGGGLYVRVRDAGTRSWIFIYTFNGKREEMGLGSLLDVTLARARERAAAAREHILDSQDPKATRRAAMAATPSKPPMTFGKFALEHLDDIEGGFKNPKHRQQWRNTLTTYAKPMWDIPIADVSTQDVLAALQPIWLTKAETASRVRGRIERVLDAAKRRACAAARTPLPCAGTSTCSCPSRPI